ncbi:glycosyl hydrolase family 3 N terminal domain-containing protein, partial [Mycena epipterygia]
MRNPTLAALLLSLAHTALGDVTTGIPDAAPAGFESYESPILPAPAVKSTGDLASAFPAGINAAATWDLGLIKARGKAMGSKHKGKGVNVALGPMTNLAAGRNWEGFGTNAILADAASVTIMNGYQGVGVIATVKHLWWPGLASCTPGLFLYGSSMEPGQPGHQLVGEHDNSNTWMYRRGMRELFGLQRHCGDSKSEISGHVLRNGVEQEERLDDLQLTKPLRVLKGQRLEDLTSDDNSTNMRREWAHWCDTTDMDTGGCTPTAARRPETIDDALQVFNATLDRAPSVQLSWG